MRHAPLPHTVNTDLAAEADVLDLAGCVVDGVDAGLIRVLAHLALVHHGDERGLLERHAGGDARAPGAGGDRGGGGAARRGGRDGDRQAGRRGAIAAAADATTGGGEHRATNGREGRLSGACVESEDFSPRVWSGMLLNGCWQWRNVRLDPVYYSSTL
jgi:hypothetical protein